MKRTVFALFLAFTLLASCGLPAYAEATAEDIMAKGDAFIASGEIDKALMCYDMATKLSSDNIDAYKRMYAVYVSFGDAVACAGIAQRAVSAMPMAYEAYFLRCDAYLMADDVLDAWMYLQIALLLNEKAQPGELAARVGNALYLSGNTEAAIEAYQLAGDIAHTAPYVRYYRIALTIAGQWERAVALGLHNARERDMHMQDIMNAPGNLRLERATQYDIDFSSCPLYVSEYYAREHQEDVVATLGDMPPVIDGRVQIGTYHDVFEEEEQPELIDISPDGTLVFRLSSYLLLYKNDSLTVVMPVASRGVPDDYRNLRYLVSKQSTHYLTGATGFIWSPDGRWAVQTNGREVMYSYQMRYDLILLDARTGDMILAETSPGNDISKGSAVLHACFDAAGEQLYYMKISLDDEQLYSLNVCDMTTLATRKLLGFDVKDSDGRDRPMAASMFMDGGGALVVPWFEYSNNRAFSLHAYQRTDGEWATTEYDLPLMDGFFEFERMQLSNNSGYGIMHGSFNATRYKQKLQKSCLVIFDTDDMYAGAYSQILLSYDALKAIRDDFSQTVDAETYIVSVPAQADIFYTCAMSPDGYHALVLFTLPDGSMQYGLLDIETLALRAVRAPEEARSSYAAFNQRIPDRGVAWLNDNTILIRADKGHFAYRLVAD